jgi:hypothetical protein
MNTARGMVLLTVGATGRNKFSDMTFPPRSPNLTGFVRNV